MKTRIAMVAAIAIMAVQFSTAQEPAKKFTTDEKKIEFATKNLIAALHSGNVGVIEAGMRVTSQIKMRFPKTDVSELVGVMNEIWQKHPAGTTRYKAYVALSVCGNPEWYSYDNNIVTADDASFFKAASRRMQEQLLSANAK